MPISLKSIALVALLLTVPGQCLALWEIAEVTPDEATKLGIVVQSKAAGSKDIRVELGFKTAGALRGFHRVDLRLGETNGEAVIAALKEDRSKEGHVTVSFTADRNHLDQIRLWIMVPQSRGGVAYEVKVKHFVELEPGK
jgi:hypothetical protein